MIGMGRHVTGGSRQCVAAMSTLSRVSIRNAANETDAQ